MNALESWYDHAHRTHSGPLEVRSFLHDLLSSSEVSDEIKRQATRALRHYPSAQEVNMLVEQKDALIRARGIIPSPLLIPARLDDSGRIKQQMERDGGVSGRRHTRDRGHPVLLSSEEHGEARMSTVLDRGVLEYLQAYTPQTVEA